MDNNEEQKQRIENYCATHTDMLSVLRDMWGDTRVQFYDDSAPPEDSPPSIFFNGPTSRSQILEYMWRPQAVRYLRELGYTGWIFVPEFRGVAPESGDFTEKDYIHEWESARRAHANVNLYWIPRNAHELLGLNTNLELGMSIGQELMRIPEERGKRIVVGWPDDALRMGLPAHYLKSVGTTPVHDLRELCRRAVELTS